MMHHLYIPLLFLSLTLIDGASLAAFHGKGFFPGTAPAPNQTVCFQFAIKHEPKQLQQLEEKLWQVSDPDGPHYGSYLSNAELKQLIAPPQEHVDTILTWIHSRVHNSTSHHANHTWIHLTKHHDMIHVCCKVEVASDIFQTEFLYYQHHKLNASSIRAARPIVVPTEVSSLLDFIGSVNTPIHRYSVRSRKMKKEYDIRHDPYKEMLDEPRANPIVVNMTGGNKEISVVFRARCVDGSPHSTSSKNLLCSHSPPTIMSFSLTLTDAFDRHIIHTVLTDACISGSSYCQTAIPVRNFDRYHVRITTHFSDHTQASSDPKGPVYASDFATPDFLRDLYGVPRGLRVQHPNNSQCVTEFLEQYYSQEDLDTYMDLMGLARENVTETIGYNDPMQGKITGGESQLDLQVMVGMAPGARTVFWSNPGRESANKEEPFLRWLTDLADTDHPPLVHSVSYGDMEEWLSIEYTDRLNIEFQKLGVRGITIIFASGDTGVASEHDFDDPIACAISHPEFPASSPYVLTVGATQLSNHNSPICNQVWRGIDIGCTTPREVVCEGPKGGVITSGGGFSRRYPRPHYQEKLVKHYLERSGVKMPPEEFFNRSGRGYPDISAYGTKYVVIMDGALVPTAGTSASTPTIASLVTLWNDIRLMNNMPPLGFINPLLYSLAERHPEAFNDVVVGSNACFVQDTPCCPNGFSAIAGWDAASGIGSPRFMELASLIRDRSHHLAYLSAPREPHPYPNRPNPTPPMIVPHVSESPIFSNIWHFGWLDVAAVTTILGLIFILVLYIKRCTAIRSGEQQPLLR